MPDLPAWNVSGGSRSCRGGSRPDVAKTACLTSVCSKLPPWPPSINQRGVQWGHFNTRIVAVFRRSRAAPVTLRPPQGPPATPCIQNFLPGVQVAGRFQYPIRRGFNRQLMAVSAAATGNGKRANEQGPGKPTSPGSRRRVWAWAPAQGATGGTPCICPRCGMAPEPSPAEVAEDTRELADIMPRRCVRVSRSLQREINFQDGGITLHHHDFLSPGIEVQVFPSVNLGITKT